VIRPATTADHPAIAAVVEAAFGGPDEARLVERLRDEGAVLVELVSEGDGIDGHVLFSRLAADQPGLYAALAPLAVRPDRQGSGLGSELTRAGLEACRALGAMASIVLGHRGYYPRFGYSAEAARNISSVYAGSPSFMALELAPDALARPLAVTYPAAFG
jgi:putative acetyltransferase